MDRAAGSSQSQVRDLAARLWLELAYADEEVDATAAGASVAELLGVPPWASVLRIRQVIYSTKGKAAIYGVGFYRSERHTLFIRRIR